MKRYDDIVDESTAPYSEDLDMEDLAMIESIINTLEHEDENEDQGKIMKWEIEDMADEI
jgi:hypothetical protein